MRIAGGLRQNARLDECRRWLWGRRVAPALLSLAFHVFLHILLETMRYQVDNSAAPICMSELLTKHPRDWLNNRYKPNLDGYLFSNSKGKPFLSDYVVKYGVHRAMAKLGIETAKGVHVGIHCFRHGDGTVSRVDEKSKKLTATITVGISGLGGDISYGADSVWASVFDVPLTRINSQTNEVARQCVGRGGIPFATDTIQYG